MASPTIVQSTSSEDDDEGTSHVVSIPASLTTGNLLVLLFVHRADGTVTWPEGYTKFGSDLQRGETDPTLSTAWREVAGAEGTTITVTTSSGAKSVHIVYEITAMIDPDTQPPERSTGATGSTGAIDPDSLSPTGGSKDYLWLEFGGQRNSNSADGASTNFANLIAKESTATNSVNCASADRANTATSEDPGVMSWDVENTAWDACVVAVHPVPSGNAPTGQMAGPLGGPLAGPI